MSEDVFKLRADVYKLNFMRRQGTELPGQVLYGSKEKVYPGGSQPGATVPLEGQWAVSDDILERHKSGQGMGTSTQGHC